MTDLDFGADREFNVQAFWGARDVTAEDLAARFVRQIDALTAIDPLFALWTCGARRPTKFETVRDHYVDEVRACISKDDFNEPDPILGYFLGAITRGNPRPLSYALRVHEGSHVPQFFMNNDAILETSAGTVPDPAAITYRIFKSALMSFVEIWNPVYGTACPSALQPLYKSPSSHFRESWIQYLSAPLAQKITPPETAIVDHLPNGGLLLSATTETFRVDNPAHMAVARDIEAAIAPLNALA